MKINNTDSIDFNILKPGIYISCINDDIITYDIRMKSPNKEPVLNNSAIHTTQHIIENYIKDTEFSDNIIYFGPMASRTGFYFITKNLSDKYSIELIKKAFAYLADFWGKIPNASLNECGNCLEHNLPQAKEEAKHFLEMIKDWAKSDLDYPVSDNEEQ